MSKIFRTAEEWADFFIGDRDWTPCADDYILVDDKNVKDSIIRDLGDGDGKRIPSAKKLDSLIITSFDDPELVHDMKPFDIIEGGLNPDENSPELRRLPSINEEDGSVDNMKWTNYRIVRSYCFIECPEDTDCYAFVCTMDDCNEHEACDTFDCLIHDCEAFNCEVDDECYSY